MPSSHDQSNAVVSSCQEQGAVMNPSSQGIQGLCKTTEAPDSSRPSLAGHLGMPRAFLAAGVISGKEESKLCDSDEM